MNQHLIFFDDTCNLCWQSVEKILAWDKKKQFYFSPLTGKAATRYLKDGCAFYKEGRTLILLEDFEGKHSKVWVRGRAVLRIFWLLGDRWKWLGLLSFFPWGVDWLYDAVAKHRHQLARKPGSIRSKEEQNRFLP